MIKNPMNMKLFVLTACCSAALFLILVLTHQSKGQSATRDQSAVAADLAVEIAANGTQSSTPSQASGRMAYIDPQTGELTSAPSDEQMRQTQTVQLEQAEAPIETIEHPDGTVELVLTDEMHSNLNAKMDCDGDVQTFHSNPATLNPTTCIEDQLKEQKNKK